MAVRHVGVGQTFAKVFSKVAVVRRKAKSSKKVARFPRKLRGSANCLRLSSQNVQDLRWKSPKIDRNGTKAADCVDIVAQTSVLGPFS